MNERLKELAEQAGIGYLYEYEMKWAWLGELEVFADLVRADERDKCAQDYLQDCCDAVDAARLEEREACAKLCESMGVYPELNVWNGGPDWYKRQKECAAAIRARGEK